MELNVNSVVKSETVPMTIVSSNDNCSVRMIFFINLIFSENSCCNLFSFSGCTSAGRIQSEVAGCVF